MAIVSRLHSPPSQPPQMMNVTWGKYYKTADKLAIKIYESGWDFNHIVCIARGGAPVADMLSRLFKKPMAYILAQSYGGEDGKEQKQLSFSQIATISKLGKKVLIVDDLVDSGKTLEAISSYVQKNNENVEEIRTAVLWSKTCSDFEPDYFAESVDENVWINQPFECYDNMTPDGLKARHQQQDFSNISTFNEILASSNEDNSNQIYGKKYDILSESENYLPMAVSDPMITSKKF